MQRTRPVAKEEGSERSDDPPPPALKVTFRWMWMSSVYEIELIKSSRLLTCIDSSVDYEVTPSIIILKIEVSPRQPPGTPIFTTWKGPKFDENDRPLSEGWLQAWELNNRLSFVAKCNGIVRLQFANKLVEARESSECVLMSSLRSWRDW